MGRQESSPRSPGIARALRSEARRKAELAAPRSIDYGHVGTAWAALEALGSALERVQALSPPGGGMYVTPAVGEAAGHIGEALRILGAERTRWERELEAANAARAAARRARFMEVKVGSIAWCRALAAAVPAELEFECPEHGDRAVWSPDHWIASCLGRDEVLDLTVPAVGDAIRKAAGVSA